MFQIGFHLQLILIFWKIEEMKPIIIASFI